MAKKKHLTKKDLREFETLLLDRKAEILSKIQGFAQDQRDRADERGRGDEADLAAAVREESLNFKMFDKNKKLLREIDHALEKFEDDTYGICEGSGEEISKERLKLRPWTRYSVEYKEEMERMRKRNML